MILLNIYIVMITVLIGLAAILYRTLWRPLQKLRAEMQEQERQMEAMRRREAELEERLRAAAKHELDQEFGPLGAQVGEISNPEQNQ